METQKIDRLKLVLTNFEEALDWYDLCKAEERRGEIDDTYIYDMCVQIMPDTRGQCETILECLSDLRKNLYV